MTKILKGFWKAICGLASAAWGLLTSIIDAAVEFIADVVGSLVEFFCDMFEGIYDLLSAGIAKLWVIIFPDEVQANEDDSADQLREWLGEAIKEKNKTARGKFSLSQGRFVVKTDNSNKIADNEDIKTFFNSSGTNMNGLDAELKNEGVVEVSI